MSLRRIVEPLEPESYLGVDIEAGPGVDEVCDVLDLRERYQDEAFDVVLSTELIEHVKNWRLAVSNFKHVLRPSGILLITTRSSGFRYHGYPSDYWRYELDDFAVIFADLDIHALERDPLAPGVFIKALKPSHFHETDIGEYKLFSVIKGRRVKRIGALDERVFLAQRTFLNRLSNVRRKVTLRGRREVSG